MAERRLDPVLRETELERNRQWRFDNPETLRRSRQKSHAAWYKLNREAKLEANRQWKLDNPEKVREYARRRRQISSIIKRSDYESREYAEILYCDPCCYCGEPVITQVARPTIDHIDPTVFGGANHWENFTAACGSCNSSKNTDSLLEFLWRR